MLCLFDVSALNRSIDNIFWSSALLNSSESGTVCSFPREDGSVEKRLRAVLIIDMENDGARN
jgi:hypothetical protein